MRISSIVFLSAAIVCGVAAAEPSAIAKITGTSKTGIVIAPINLSWAADSLPLASGRPVAVSAVTLPDKTAVAAQFVPDDGFDVKTRPSGAIVLKLPGQGDWQVELRVAPGTDKPMAGSGVIAGGGFTVEFGKNGSAPFPSKFVYGDTRKVFDSFAWNDRLYDNETHDQYWLRFDKTAASRVVSTGPLCTVVRSHARYCKPDGASHPANPSAIYDWYIFNDLGLMFVTAAVRQESAFIWDELHFLELNFPDESFKEWAGAQPEQHGELTSSKKSQVFSEWGGLSDGANVIGMFGGKTTIYDGRGEYGAYLNATWEPFRDRERQLKTWLHIGSSERPGESLAETAAMLQSKASVIIMPTEFMAKMDALRAEAAKQDPDKRRRMLWDVSLAETLQAQGANADENDLVRTTAGDAGLAVQSTGHGIRVVSLYDLRVGKELAAAKQQPLFEIALQKSPKDTVRLTSDDGWKKVAVTNGDHLELVFSEPDDNRLNGISVIVTANPLPGQDGFAWRIAVDDQNPEWALWDVRFPQVSVARLGEKTTVLFPRGPGAITRDLWNESFSFDGRYPSGWCSMQLAAVYDEAAGTGLYFARHDDRGNTKDMVIDSDPAAEAVRLAFSEPVANMGATPNKHELHGEAVWQVLRGDWFDAAMIYKNWVRAHAQWWPKLANDGREDTPLWMRELCAWAQTGGGPAEVIQHVKDFQTFLGVPVGFHWYSWHQIPFDNDYPHYFPAKEGFADAVKDLQDNNVYVMPYINGRLWDTRDKGAEDFEFTKIALPSATKDADGKPHTESYASKEADGSKVTLAVMCPVTPLWQKTVKDIVLRLQNECGTKGVYIDQIAAASPVLCMDKTHGHPLGGGYWWNEGYWQLLDGIRKEMQPDRMITTECNAEPFARWLDGYLTWHWQYDGQVPVFPAIYGGALQMFGRAYGAGATKDLALRMRAAQQLVFGEQLGWLDPKMLLESESKDFFKQAVRTRYQFRRYFYAGEMARPPRLSGVMPQVKADWQWGGEMWVTTDAVLTGAWQLPDDHKLLLIFANVSDAPVTLDYEFDGRAYGFASEQLSVHAYDGETPGEKSQEKSPLKKPITLAPRKIIAWEIQ